MEKGKDLYRLNLRVRLAREVESSAISMEQVHAFFMNLFPKEVASRLHKPHGFKPFALWIPSLFRKNREKTGGFRLVVSIVGSELFRDLCRVLLNAPEGRIGELRAKLELPKIDLFDIKDLASMWDLSRLPPPAEHRFSFSFLTPTTFRKRKVDYPLPEPALVFKGLIKKWNYFSCGRIPVDLGEAIEGKLTVSMLKIRTARTRIGNEIYANGFMGDVVFIGNGLTPEEARWLNILGLFSRFVGVGRKCTMGMGMTDYKSPPT